VTELVEGLFPRVDLVPGQLALPAIRLLHRRVEHALAGTPDVGTGAIAFDERDDGLIRHVEGAGCGHGDRVAVGGLWEGGGGHGDRRNTVVPELWQAVTAAGEGLRRALGLRQSVAQSS